MKPVSDSAEGWNRDDLDFNFVSSFRWVLIIFSTFFLPLGFTLSTAVGHSQTSATTKNSIIRVFSSNPESSNVSSITPTPVPKQDKFRLKGYVYNKSRTLVPSLTVTLSDPGSGYTSTHNVGGKFIVSVPYGTYNITMRDRSGHLNQYSNIVVNSDTSIKFSFNDYLEVTSTPTPRPTPVYTPTPAHPEPTVSPTPVVIDHKVVPKIVIDPKVVPKKNKPNTDTGGKTDPLDSVIDDSEPNDELNANVNSNNENDKSDKKLADTKQNSSTRRQPSFFSRTPVKIALTILGGLLVAGLVGLSLPLAANAAAWMGGFLGGFGIAGGTAAVSDDVKCTLFTPPEVSTGSDLLVQVFAHLDEQTDGLDELATMLDPEARKQLSKSLKEKIKRDSVLTFKLMIPGIEFDEDEQDIVWRGEPDSVEFIVPIPDDHGDGNRFGRVFVYQNGDELGKIPFRIKIVSSEQNIPQVNTEPSVAGVMTQNETAFVSYSSKDKDEVYRFVQLMDVLKYDYHIDVFHIEAGERWEKKLYKFIDTDDVFLLFWSESARQSEWVIREAKRAEQRAKSDPSERPRIIVYTLDQEVPVPEWLQDFHVDRKWAGMIDNIKSFDANSDSNIS